MFLQCRSTVNLESAADILRWVDELADSHEFCNLRSSLRSHYQLAERKAPFTKLLDRDEALRVAIDYISCPVHSGPEDDDDGGNDDNNDDDNNDDDDDDDNNDEGNDGDDDDAEAPTATENIGMCATLAARGCGKSRILDEIARLCPSRQVPKCVAIVTTFNGGQDSDLDEGIVPVHETDSVAGAGRLLSRLVHRAFFHRKTDFGKFLSVTNHAWRSIQSPKRAALAVFEAMRQFFSTKFEIEDPIVVIILDELVRAGSHAGEVLQLLKQLLSSPRSSKNCRVFVSTLGDKVDSNPQLMTLRDPLGFKESGSSRPLFWMMLTPIRASEVRHFLRRRLTQKQTDYAIALSGGHPRTLQILCDKAQGNTADFDTLISSWFNQLRAFAIPQVTNALMQTLIAKAVLGRTLQVSDAVANVSVQRLLEWGILLNTVDPSSGLGFVPQLCIARLHSWADHSQIRIAVCMRTLLQLGSKVSHTAYEQFTLLFEEIRCWAWHHLGLDRDCSVGDWFGEAAILPATASTRMLFIPNPELSSPTAVLSNHLAKCSSTTVVKCHMACEGQPGFDSLLSMGDLVAFESRFSQPLASTKVMRREIWKKAVLAQEQIDLTSAKMPSGRIARRVATGPISSPHSLLVMSMLRETGTTLHKFAQFCMEQPGATTPRMLPDYQAFQDVLQQMPVVLFDRAALLNRYGTTFAGLAGFIFQYSELKISVKNNQTNLG